MDEQFQNTGPTSFDAVPSKVPKRKRLAKACDACHKSKRRCDGTALCSNCYYASKACIYTDASGRSVPAPRRQQEEEDSEDRTRKRFRQHNDQPSASTSAPESLERVPSLALEPAITRELTNLFFAHCHPAMVIIHKPTFTSSLSHNLIPLYLLQVVCALAAPHSKQQSLRANPSRMAGIPFAEAARSIMFDAGGRFLLQPSLYSAQALCLLSAHDAMTSGGRVGFDQVSLTSQRYRYMTLDLIQSLGVHRPEFPLLTPVPSQSMVHDSIERECIRRIFWSIYYWEGLRDMYCHTIYPTPQPSNRTQHEASQHQPLLSHQGSSNGFHAPPTEAIKDAPDWAEPDHRDQKRRQWSGKDGPSGILGLREEQLRLRLPADETSFELAAIHSTLPEYLNSTAHRTQYASEMGHMIRVLTIYQRIECAMDSLFAEAADVVSTSGIVQHNFNHVCSDAPMDTLAECYRLLQEWVRSLPPHLEFTAENVSVQKSMIGTPSNSGSWCYAQMHIFHAGSALGLGVATRMNANGAAAGPEDGQNYYWAIKQMEIIMEMMGERAKSSILFGTVLWPLMRYCNLCDDPRLQEWAKEYEVLFGMKMSDRLVGRKLQRQMLDLRPPNSDPASTSHLGRSLGQLHLSSTTSPPRTSSPSTSHRTSSSSDSDSVNGTATPKPNGNSSTPTLPSLKASGLLDEWNQNGKPRHHHGNEAPKPGPVLHNPSQSTPVGLPWLLNESR
ncbi:hypothetical protein C8J56DRAFT_953877 [Mycena floridula]|nr:hypothetical protein C8J56DRAFT_953877 [Mycena floridula]